MRAINKILRIITPKNKISRLVFIFILLGIMGMIVFISVPSRDTAEYKDLFPPEKIDKWLFFYKSIGIAFISFVIGGTVGFIFGVPTQKGQLKFDGEEPKEVFNVNTNLQIVSDWLSKAIVIIFLLELNSIFQIFEKSSKFFRSYLGDFSGSAVYPFIIVFYFAVIGILTAYFITRIYFDSQTPGEVRGLQYNSAYLARNYSIYVEQYLNVQNVKISPDGHDFVERMLFVGLKKMKVRESLNRKSIELARVKLTILIERVIQESYEKRGRTKRIIDRVIIQQDFISVLKKAKKDEDNDCEYWPWC